VISKKRIAALLLIFLIVTSNTSSYAQEKSLILEGLKTDPARLCPVKDHRIPKTLPKLKQLAPIKSIKELSCNSFLPEEVVGCVAESIKFDGLEIIAVVPRKELWLADIEVGNAKFDFLGSTLKVGAPISDVEKLYGKKIPIKNSPVVLQGECVPLTVWHSHGLITKVKLTCSAC
jgi:hypothetical protein